MQYFSCIFYYSYITVYMNSNGFKSMCPSRLDRSAPSNVRRTLMAHPPIRSESPLV